MGLFSRNFDKPGPGVEKDAPRKTGAARFFEIFFRDFADLIKLSLLFSLLVLPTAVCFLIGLLLEIMPFLSGQSDTLGLFFLIISIPLAYPVGGAMSACFFNITRFMRDDPSYLWHDFKRKFAENHKQAALTGIVCTAFVYLQIILWVQIFYQLVSETYAGGLVMLLVAGFSILLFFMITPYIFMHYAYIDLKTAAILKNSVLMTLAYLPRSFMGALCGGIIWVLIAAFVPHSLAAVPLVPIILVSLSMMLFLTWTWPKFNDYFKIEETLKNKNTDTDSEGL